MTEETRYTFEQISRATGVSVQRLEERRRSLGLTWHPKGYTLSEVEQMVSGCALPLEHDMVGCRSKKAAELYRLLLGGGAAKK